MAIVILSHETGAGERLDRVRVVEALPSGLELRQRARGATGSGPTSSSKAKEQALRAA